MAHKTFHFPIEHIRLGEFDLGGVLFHANYFHLLESTREAFLNEGGIPYPTIIADASHLAIAESHQSFKAPIFYGQSLQVKLWIEELKGSSVKVCYQIFSKGEKVPLHEAWTRLVYVKNTGRGYRAERIPENLRNLFTQFEKRD